MVTYLISAKYFSIFIVKFNARFGNIYALLNTLSNSIIHYYKINTYIFNIVILKKQNYSILKHNVDHRSLLNSFHFNFLNSKLLFKAQSPPVPSSQRNQYNSPFCLTLHFLLNSTPAAHYHSLLPASHNSSLISKN